MELKSGSKAQQAQTDCSEDGLEAKASAGFFCPSLPVRSVPAGCAGHVSDVGPGPGHSGTLRQPPEDPLLSLLPSQHPARPVVPPGPSRRLLLPAGRPALHPGRPELSWPPDHRGLTAIPSKNKGCFP